LWVTAGFFLAIGWFYLFLTHARSTFLWERISILAYLQFPWRFLIIAVFAFSVAGGCLVKVVEGRRSKMIVVATVFILLLGLNARFFRPREWVEISDKEKFSGELWERQLTISIFDYLPKSAKFPPSHKAPEEPVIWEERGQVISGQKGSYWQLWRIKIDEENTKVRLPIIYFPDWRVTCDGETVSIDYSNDLGVIEVFLDEGEHEVFAQLVNTPIRSVGNYLTFAGFAAVPVYLKKRRHK